MKIFTTPGLKETREILVKMKVRKAKKKVGRCALELVKSKLDNVLNGKPQSANSKACLSNQSIQEINYHDGNYKKS